MHTLEGAPTGFLGTLHIICNQALCLVSTAPARFVSELDFIRNMLAKLEWDAFRAAATALEAGGELPEEVNNSQAHTR